MSRADGKGSQELLLEQSLEHLCASQGLESSTSGGLAFLFSSPGGLWLLNNQVCVILFHFGLRRYRDCFFHRKAHAIKSFQ